MYKTRPGIRNIKHKLRGNSSSDFDDDDDDNNSEDCNNDKYFCDCPCCKFPWHIPNGIWCVCAVFTWLLVLYADFDIKAQLVVLSAQISWSESVEAALKQIESNLDLLNKEELNPLESVLKNVENTLKILADTVLQDQLAIRRRKLEHLIIEYVHQRDVIRELINKKVASSKSFDWLCQMRFYFDPKVTNVIRQLSIQMANSKCCMASSI